MNSLFKSRKKKGSLAMDVLTVVIVIFVFALIGLFFRVVFNNVVDAFTTAGIINDSDPQAAQANTVRDAFTRGANAWDYVMVLLLVGVLIGIGVLSYKIAAPPVFFLLMWIYAPFLGLASYFFNYVFSLVVSLDVFVAVQSSFPITLVVCTNLHWVALLAIAIGSITLYVKRDKGQFV